MIILCGKAQTIKINYLPLKIEYSINSELTALKRCEIPEFASRLDMYARDPVRSCHSVRLNRQTAAWLLYLCNNDTVE